MKNNFQKEWSDFMLKDSQDPFGRTRKLILLFSEEQLENTHNYIQWLFPTFTQSNFNDTSPVLDEKFINSLENKNKICQLLQEHFDLMYNFYFNPKTLRPYHWLSKNNHNFLRITRMLLCLKYFNYNFNYRNIMEELSFLKEDFPDIITDNTFSYWIAAYQESDIENGIV